MEPMQALELAGVCALIGMAAYSLRGRLANLNEEPLGFKLAVGFGIGAIIALFMLVRKIDLLPDDLEPLARLFLTAALLAAAILVARRNIR